MTNLEQWKADHEASLGYHSKRLTAAGTVLLMTDAELDDAILNSRSGLVTAARQERNRRIKSRTHSDLRRAIRAYTDNTCTCVLYNANETDRSMGIA